MAFFSKGTPARAPMRLPSRSELEAPYIQALMQQKQIRSQQQQNQESLANALERARMQDTLARDKLAVTQEQAQLDRVAQAQEGEASRSQQMSQMQLMRDKFNLDKDKAQAEQQQISNVQAAAKQRADALRSGNVAEFEALTAEHFPDQYNQLIKSKADSKKIAQGLKKQGIDIEKNLRGEWTKAIGNFKEVDEAYQRIKASPVDKETATGASDIALITNYMKMLDPRSVVREGEFATAENAGGVPETVRNLYNKLMSGDKLSEQVRKDYLSQVDRLYKNASKTHKDQKKTFSDLAGRYGVNPDNVIIDLTTNREKDTAEKDLINKAASDMTEAELLAEIQALEEEG